MQIIMKIQIMMGIFMFAFFNIKSEDIEIKKRRMYWASYLFKKFEVIDNDNAEGERTGGFGSTNK